MRIIAIVIGIDIHCIVADNTIPTVMLRVLRLRWMYPLTMTATKSKHLMARMLLVIAAATAAMRTVQTAFMTVDMSHAADETAMNTVAIVLVLRMLHVMHVCCVHIAITTVTIAIAIAIAIHRCVCMINIIMMIIFIRRHNHNLLMLLLLLYLSRSMNRIEHRICVH